MALPKYKQSKSNSRTRRAVWLNSLRAPEIHDCPNCGSVKLMHRACAYCGFYNGKFVPALKRVQD